MSIFSILLTLLWLGLSIYYLFFYNYNPVNSITIPGLLFIVFFLITTSVAFYVIGIGTARGRLIFMLGVGSVILAIGFFLISFQIKNYILYPILYLGRLTLAFAVLSMFLELTRRGYGLSIVEFIQVILVYIILVAFGYFLLLKNIRIDERFYYNIILIVLDYLVSLIALMDLRIYWGSSIGIGWIIGAISSIILLLGDILFIAYHSNANPIYMKIASILWGLPAVLLGSYYSNLKKA